MTQHADVHLETDRTRAVGDVDVSAEPDADPHVQFDPVTPSITVGGGTPTNAGEIRLRDAQDTYDLGLLSANGSHGSLVLSGSSGRPVVSLDADVADDIPAVEVSDGSSRTATVETTRMGVFYGSGDDAPAVGADDSGTLSVTNDTRNEPRTTIELDGEKSALLLSGTPETGTESDDAAIAKYGGGELVVRSRAENDIHVHVQGELESDYGAYVDNYPRIHLNGPEADLELGRQRIDSDRQEHNGEIYLRTDTGQSVLELRAREDSESEVVFRWSDGSTAEPRGKLRSHPRGLMVYDAGGHEALLISGQGEVETRREIDEGGL